MSSSLPQQAALSMDLNYSYTQTGTNVQLHSLTFTNTHRILHHRRNWPFAVSQSPNFPSSFPLRSFLPFIFFLSLAYLSPGHERSGFALSPLFFLTSRSPTCLLVLTCFAQHIRLLCLLVWFLIITHRPHHYLLKSDLV